MKMLALGPMGAQGPEQGMIAARPVCPVDRYAPESLMTIEFSVTNNVFARDILTVAQLNQAVGQLLERSIPAIWVRGEISNFTQAASGHWYFTIRTAAPPCGRSCSAAAPARWGSSSGRRPGRDPGARVAVRTARRLPVAGRRHAAGRAGQPVRSLSAAQGATGVRGAVRPGAQARAGAAAPGDRRDHLAARGRAARCAVGTGPARAASSRHHLSGPGAGRRRGRPAGRASAAGQSARRSGYPAAGARRRQH